jgi:hypothetical protein
MKEIKKYTDVVRYGKNGTQDVINKGDYITITEKIDGANASFIYDEESPIGVTAYSRNNPISEDNNLRGYYQWIIQNIVPIKSELNKTYRYYGEWLVSHKVVYKPEQYQNFYLFSIWDEETNQYLSDEIVKSEAKRLGLQATTYFYEGEYISFEHIMNFVGKSDRTLEPNTGEGVVVKNVNYKDRYGNQMFVKLVSERFAEVQKQKLPKNPNVVSEYKDTIDAIVTKPRVEKLISKFVDEGILIENYGIENIGIILKNISVRVYEDVMKEEQDLIKNIEESILIKNIQKTMPKMVKSILLEQGRM